MAGKFLRCCDPRIAALHYPGGFVVGYVALFFLFGTYGNYRVLELRGGITDDALPADNPYKQMHEYVHAKEGFSPEEMLPIIVKLSGSEADGWQEVITLTQEVKKQLDGGVLSLAEMPDYRDTGDELLKTPYLTPQSLKNARQPQWRARVASDVSTFGVLVNRDWRWAAVTRFLPRGYRETQEAWKTVELLEGRKIPWWERIFLKADVEPKNPNIGVSGWVMGRWQIDQAMNRDVLMLPSLGMILSFLILRFFLGSSRQAALAVFINIIGGIWLTRAFIWPLHAAGTGMLERIYTTVAYANVIVQGMSFALHKLETFREASGKNSQERFVNAQSIDAEIGLVAIIAIIAFLCMNTFPIWQMREMGYQSAVGVMLVLAGATVFIPAFYLVLERLLGPEHSTAESQEAETEQPQGHWLGKLQVPAWIAISIPLLTFTIAACLFWTGRIETKTTPWDYMKGTLVDKTFQFLKDSGNEFIDLLAEPVKGNIYQPDFIRDAWHLQSDLMPHYGANRSASRFEQWQQNQGLTPVLEINEVASILGKVHQIAQESYKKDWPESPDEVDDTFFLLTEGMSAEVNHQMWFSGGLRLAGLTIVNDSTKARTLIERVLRFAQEEYPSLKVSVFGKMIDYTQMDLYVTQGEAPNIAVSLIFVFISYLLWVIVRNRSLRLQHRAVLRPMLGTGIMVLPFLFGVGVIGILLWYLGIPLSLSTAPIADIAINASADFSIYIVVALLLGLGLDYTAHTAVGYALTAKGTVVFTDFLLNAIAFAPLLTSRFQPVRELGWLMDFMLFTCTVGALIFVPSALPLAVAEQSASRKTAPYEKTVRR
ncbi:MAG: hypothetical protein HY268_34045 [Deltaproteobacteria bacterium]|nr:hypothetical protein [Deltaproteobacteria bacterium]